MENSEIIYGKNSVMEALIAGNREINKILISKNIHTDNKINKIKETCTKQRYCISICRKGKSSSHMRNLIIKG